MAMPVLQQQPMERCAGGDRIAVVRARFPIREYQGRGIASRVLRHLAIIARARGISTFEADVLADNKAMQAVFGRCGWPLRSRREGDTVHLQLTLPEGAA